MGFTRQIRHHPHDKGQLHLFLCPVEFHIIFDLNPWRTVAGDEFLRVTRHRALRTTP